MTDDERRDAAVVPAVSPAARDQAIERLQDHYAHNQLEVQDFERLVEMAERARSNTELARLFDGLPASPEAARAELVVAEKPAGRVTATVSATLGSNVRRGRWRVPSYVKAAARFGSVEMDLSDADLSRGETVIEVSALFGSVEITVPEGLAIECEGNAVLGSFDHYAADAASRRDARRVRIVGRAVFGSVDIKVKKRTGVLEDIKSVVRGLLGP
jgi:hypothetical protein